MVTAPTLWLDRSTATSAPSPVVTTRMTSESSITTPLNLRSGSPTTWISDPSGATSRMSAKRMAGGRFCTGPSPNRRRLSEPYAVWINRSASTLPRSRASTRLAAVMAASKSSAARRCSASVRFPRIPDCLSSSAIRLRRRSSRSTSRKFSGSVARASWTSPSAVSNSPRSKSASARFRVSA